MLNKLKPKTEYSKHILTLMSGTILAQAIPIAISPILTRLYSPSDFGTFSLYFALAVLFGSLAAGRYELSILIPKQHESARQIVLFSIVISFVMSVLLFVFVCIAINWLVQLLNNPDIRIWLYVLPVNIFMISVINILYYWFNRHKEYKVLAKTKILQSSNRSTFSLLFGFFHKPYGLVTSVFIGSLSNFMYSIIKAKNDNVFHTPNMQKMKILMKKYRDFPKFNVLTTLVENLSGNIPIYLLTIFFDPMVVGFFSLSQQVVRAPLSIIGVSFGDVFRQRASCDLQHTGDCRHIFLITFKKLAILATLPFILFYFIAPILFLFVFGEKWEMAGTYAQIMTPMFFLQFISSPLSNMFLIAQKQKLDLLIQIFSFIIMLTGMTVGYYISKDVSTILYIFTFIYSIKYLIQLTLSYRFTKVSNA